MRDQLYLLAGAALCFGTGAALCFTHVCQGDSIPSILFTGGVGAVSAIAGIARASVHPGDQAKQ